MRILSNHYHMLGAMGVLEHEHLVNPGRPHVHVQTDADEIELGPSTDTLPQPPQLRGEGHQSPALLYRPVDRPT